ncbi:mRNA export factor MEX67 [Cyphellophora attinorum]|uniref:mRNA export factor MEX67 n=1 Tax=Cyphellophora attinorum TaxID=1664694 RepID=A0A0N0NRJ7_9EURO|nr:mRNA export factor MEX67 [Phialophora attinorum]KPI44929.1 mRNA export factor MEX67 [Phialophora attinorum]
MSFASRITQPGHHQNQQQSPSQTGTISLAVKGWASGPKFSQNPTEAQQIFHSWLGKKAGRPILSHRYVGNAGTICIIEVNAHDRPRFDHLNGFTFSGGVIVVEDARPPKNQQQQNGSFNPPAGPRQSQSQPSTGARIPSGPRYANNTKTFGSAAGGDTSMNGQPATQAGSEKQQLEAILTNVVRKRYNAAEKYLTLESLAADPDIVSAGLTTSSASKVFTAIFTMCEKFVFETPAKRRDMVVSVSLSGNALGTVQDIIALPSTFPNLQNLDLSNNQLKDTKDFRFWRNNMRNLEHLIITGNPIDTNIAEKEKLIRWWRKLKMINGQPITRGSSLANAMTLEPSNTNGGPDRTASPAPPFAFANTSRPTQGHPEFPPDSNFGLPEPGKTAEQLQMEQMGLKFSFETRLNMKMTEQCLVANGWDYDKALRNLGEMRNKRLREDFWAVSGDDDDELEKMWEEGSELGEDDHVNAQEEAEERLTFARYHRAHFESA